MVNIVTPAHMSNTHNKRTERGADIEQGTNAGNTAGWSWEHKEEVLVVPIGGTTAIPAPEHTDGQTLTVIAVGTINSGQFQVLTGSFTGHNIRRVDDRTYSDSGGASDLAIRAREVIEFVSAGGSWWIKSWDKAEYYGPGYREDARGDGRVSANGFQPSSGTIAVNASLQSTVALPVPIFSGQLDAVPVSSVAGAAAFGNRISPVQVLTNSATTTTVDIVMHNSTNGTTNNSAYWTHDGGRLL